MRIYVGTYGNYNNGSIKGEWIDLPCDNLDEKLLFIFGEGDHEYMIQDFEADFKIRECEDLTSLNAFAEKYDALSEHDQKKVCYLIEDGEDREDALEGIEDVIFYEDMKMVDVVENMVDEGLFGDIPKAIQNYIDYEAIARDLSYDGYHETSEGVFHRS